MNVSQLVFKEGVKSLQLPWYCSFRRINCYNSLSGPKILIYFFFEDVPWKIWLEWKSSKLVCFCVLNHRWNIVGTLVQTVSQPYPYANVLHKNLFNNTNRLSNKTSTPQYNLFQEFTSKCWVLELYLYSNMNNRHGKTPIAL